jgi:hypothetical protein
VKTFFSSSVPAGFSYLFGFLIDWLRPSMPEFSIGGHQDDQKGQN